MSGPQEAKVLVSQILFMFHYFFFQGSAFQSLLPAVKDKIIESFTPEARDMFEREFDFFDKVTSISGVLFPLPKDERRAGIRR